jgi:lipopolysaccharide export system protein LptC
VIQHYKSFAALVILTVFSMWILKHTSEFIEIIELKPLAKSEHDVDYFSVGYTKLQMDEFGLPSNKLFADYVVHYRDISEIKLVKPVATLYKEDKATWILHSKHGVITDNGDELFLNGRVLINKVVDRDEQKVTINTSNIKVEPKKYFAATIEKAQMVSKADIITGIGMRLFYKSPLRVELLAEVRGKHVYR